MIFFNIGLVTPSSILHWKQRITITLPYPNPEMKRTNAFSLNEGILRFFGDGCVDYGPKSVGGFQGKSLEGGQLEVRSY
jgi:hypothetical protein